MNYSEWRVCWSKKSDRSQAVYSDDFWYPLEETTVHDLDQLVKDYEAVVPSRTFWIEYR